MQWILVAAVVGVFGWFLHVWVGRHGLAELTPSGWELAAAGWPALWPVLLAGLVPGLVVGLVAGSELGELVLALAAYLRRRADKQAAQKHAEVQALRSELDRLLIEAEDRGRMAGEQMAREATEARLAAEDRARYLERRLQAMQGRLKGAQQKAARLKRVLEKRSVLGDRTA